MHHCIFLGYRRSVANLSIFFFLLQQNVRRAVASAEEAAEAAEAAEVYMVFI